MSKELLKLMHPAQDNIEGKLGMVPEPFGYFRCTLDGWIDCAETDEGARPLYEYAEIAKRDAEIERLRTICASTQQESSDMVSTIATLRAKLRDAEELAESRLQQMQADRRQYLDLRAKLAGVDGLVEAMQEVLRISDRKHEAWDTAKDAIARYQSEQKERKEITQ